MAQSLTLLIRTARPAHWIKNLSLFAALVFTGGLFTPELFLKVLAGAAIFSLLASSTYFFNDIFDVSRDRAHPRKKNRPIAAGRLSLPTALFVAIVGFFLSLYFAMLLSGFFFIACLAYLLLQIAYSLILKNIEVLDVLSIAGGFILRVYAGAFVIGAHLSVWFLLCVVSVALFLAVGKRRAELALLAGSAVRHRQAFIHYSERLIDAYLSMFATAAWVSWALFTFFEPPPPVTKAFPFLTTLPLTLAGINKWLMITIPVVIYGVMRYLRIIYEGVGAGSPENVLIKDRPLLVAAALWGLLVVGVIYGVNP